MSDYSRVHDFSVKDALSPGDSNKKIKGSEVDAEFDLLVTAVNSKADDTDYLALRNATPTASGILAPHKNLVLSCTTGAAIDVDADEIVLTDGTNYYKGAVNKSMDLTAAAGVESVDTGTLTAGWWDIWVIYNGTTVSTVASKTSGAGPGTFPGGYTYYGLAGSVYATSTTVVRPFNQMDSTVALITPIAALGGSTSTAATELNVAAFVPDFARKVKMNGNRVHTASSAGVYVVTASVYSRNNITATGDLWRWSSGEGHVNGTTFQHRSTGTVLMTTAQRVWHNIDSPGGTTTANYLDLDVTGFEY